MRAKKDLRPRDYLGNLIEVGDAYFYGSPTEIGKVIQVKKTTIVIDLSAFGGKHYGYKNHQMNCKSPEKGLCLNKLGNYDFT